MLSLTKLWQRFSINIFGITIIHGARSLARVVTISRNLRNLRTKKSFKMTRAPDRKKIDVGGKSYSRRKPWTVFFVFPIVKIIPQTWKSFDKAKPSIYTFNSKSVIQWFTFCLYTRIIQSCLPRRRRGPSKIQNSYGILLPALFSRVSLHSNFLCSV